MEAELIRAVVCLATDTTSCTSSLMSRNKGVRGIPAVADHNEMA